MTSIHNSQIQFTWDRHNFDAHLARFPTITDICLSFEVSIIFVLETEKRMIHKIPKFFQSKIDQHDPSLISSYA